MAKAMLHRGPDDQGCWADGDVALGFTRLSIIDLAGGRQPMCNEDASVWVVYNGEIYNHRELRRELESKGHQFKSDHSDTEVLVHGWEEWGPLLVERLNGMFAFGIWDQRERTLFLARDRYGIKPLYLAELASGGLVFASEVRGVLASGLVEQRGSPEGVLQYLSFQNFWNGATPFVGIELLPPGSHEIVSVDKRRRSRYWVYSFSRKERRDITGAAQRYREILLDVMRRQMDADVPISTYLSGGIDSSAVTAAAHRLDREVKAYSCIFDLTGVGDDKIVDEREHSRSVASFLGIDRIEMELPRDVLSRTLDDTIRALEYPRMGMAYVNYLISGRVSQDTKVVLSGMGGDEITGGYVGRYQITDRCDTEHTNFLKRLLLRLRSESQTQSQERLAAYRLALNFPIPMCELEQALTPEFLHEAQDFSPEDQIQDMIGRCDSKDPWDIVMFVDANTYLHGLLVMEDKLSMAHSLETRVPLLDNELVDYLLDLPWDLLNDGESGKIVFREAVRPWVPDEIYRKPKMGFGPPDASWYRGLLRPWIAAQLDERVIAARGILNPVYVRQKLADHFSGKANNLPLIWSLLSLESWCRQFDMFGGVLEVPEIV